jgi:hypothetical protein
MAHRCPVIDARARFRGPIGMVELPNLIFSKLSHLPHAADFRARSNSGASWAVCCACVYPPKVVLLRYRAAFLNWMVSIGDWHRDYCKTQRLQGEGSKSGSMGLQEG